MLVQLAAERTGFHPVSRTVFRPQPNVDSALVAFRRRELPERFRSVKRVVEAAFAHRRKTLPNSLALAGVADRAQAAEALAAIGRSPATSRRGARAAPSSSSSNGCSHERRGSPMPRSTSRSSSGRGRADGKHEVTTVLQRVALADRVRSSRRTLCASRDSKTTRSSARALELLATEAGIEPRWRVGIDEGDPRCRRPRRRELGRAAALALANATLDRPLAAERLHELAADLGADVPFFLADGPQLGEGDGTRR